MRLFRKTLEETYADEASLEIAAAEQCVKLAQIEISAGENLLDAPDDETALVTDRLIHARAAITVTRSKIEASRLRRQTMVEQLQTAKIMDERTSAERLKRALEKLTGRLTSLLAEAAEINGVVYDLSILNLASQTPLHVKLRNDIQTHENEADRLTRNPPKFNKASRVSGSTARELYEKAHTDATQLQPTLEQFEQVVAEQRKVALSGIPPATGFMGSGGYKQLGGFSKLAVEARGLIFRVEYTGSEVTGATFELAPLAVPHANVQDPGRNYRDRGLPDPNKWDSALSYSSDGTGSKPRPSALRPEEQRVRSWL